jgi:integrase
MSKLTKRVVDAVESTGLDHFIWDSQMPGFGLRISPKGQKSFLIQYRHQGKTQRMRLGRMGRVTADDARRQARILLGQAEAGKNPAAILVTKRKNPTLASVAERFVAEHIDVRLKPRTAANYRSVLRVYILPALGDKRITNVCLADLNALHSSLSDKPSQANRAVLVMSKLLNLSEQWGLRTMGSNPAGHIQLFKDNKRNRFLDKAELRRLWETLALFEREERANAYAIQAYRLLILTGCRLGEIQTLKWSYIRANRVEFPDSKTGYKRLPLNAKAMEVLNRTVRQEDNPYVICGDKPGAHIVNLQKSWRRIRTEAGLEGLRIHDLRHTFASQAVMNGTPLALVSKLLGHSKIATTMRYAHLADSELMLASEGIGNLLGQEDE